MFGNREYLDFEIISQRTANDLIWKKCDQNCLQACSMQSDLSHDVSTRNIALTILEYQWRNLKSFLYPFTILSGHR